jgi:hypothetical protein
VETGCRGGKDSPRAVAPTARQDRKLFAPENLFGMKNINLWKNKQVVPYADSAYDSLISGK